MAKSAIDPRVLLVPALVLLATATLGGGATAATVPVGFSEQILTSALSAPTAMAIAPDPDNRVFVTQQGGALRVIKNDVLLATAFTTLTVDSNGERGLLGVALDPNFATNHFLYLYYTVPATSMPTVAAHNRVSRFTANGDVVLAASEVVLLNLNDLSGATNHNGGALHFGNDGKLYIAVGENANGNNAQDQRNLLGKILRINSDGTIPANPATASLPGFTTGTVRPEIWAMGLRNPYTFSFRRTGTRMFINDVGQSAWEEINDGLGGSNYGWNATEGATTMAGVVAPLFSYFHDGSICAITGGAFYDPPTVQFSSTYVGKYFFSDFCGGWIHIFDPAAPATVQSFVTGISGPVDLQVDSAGLLYYLGHNNGTLGRIAARPAASFNTVAPCRQIDTRTTTAIAANTTSTFTLSGGVCGIPAAALSAAINVTVVSPTQTGNLVLYAGNQAQAPTSTVINFSAGKTRANNATLALATNGDGSIKVQNNSAAAVQIVIDAAGYYN
ncbi:MAG: PQQ-dependent sugar dehydrogenase [Acidobacteriota bacterium]